MLGRKKLDVAAQIHAIEKRLSRREQNASKDYRFLYEQIEILQEEVARLQKEIAGLREESARNRELVNKMR